MWRQSDCPQSIEAVDRGRADALASRDLSLLLTVLVPPFFCSFCCSCFFLSLVTIVRDIEPTHSIQEKPDHWNWNSVETEDVRLFAAHNQIQGLQYMPTCS